MDGIGRDRRGGGDPGKGKGSAARARSGKPKRNRCLKATLRIRTRDCVTKQGYETRLDPTSDLLAKILSQNGNGPLTLPLMYFGCPGLLKGDGTPGHTTYLPGGRPGGRPGLAGALVEREEAAKLYSVEEEAEEVVEEVVGVRDRFVLRGRVEIG